MRPILEKWESKETVRRIQQVNYSERPSTLAIGSEGSIIQMKYVIHSINVVYFEFIHKKEFISKS